MQLIRHNPSLQNLWDPRLFWKGVIYTLFQAEVFTVAAKLKVLAHKPAEVGAPTQPHIEGVNNVIMIPPIELHGEIHQTFCYRFTF